MVSEVQSIQIYSNPHQSSFQTNNTFGLPVPNEQTTYQKLITTTSNYTGRTYIAGDQHYIGSINTYNNWFTKNIASLFGFSMTVKFDHTELCVNKKSYEKLLKEELNISNVSSKNIQDYSNFAEKVNLISTSNGFLRDKIDSRTSMELFKKLVNAIDKNENVKAIHYIEHGALIDKEFFHRGKDLSILFNNDMTQGLDSNKLKEFNVTKATPLLFASTKIADIKKLRPVVKKLLEYGANANIVGERYRFQMETVGEKKKVPKISDRSIITLKVNDYTFDKYFFTEITVRDSSVINQTNVNGVRYCFLTQRIVNGMTEE